MADINVTFGADSSEFDNVIARATKELANFASSANSAFGASQKQLADLAAASEVLNKALSEQASKLKAIESASRAQAPGGSGSRAGLEDSQIKSIQAGLAESSRSAAQLAAEMERAAKSGLNDDQIRAINTALSTSVSQVNALSGEFNKVSASEKQIAESLSKQAGQYTEGLAIQKQINNVLDQRLSKSKEIELAAKPQRVDASSSIGLTQEQIRLVQAALSNSAEEARKLRDEFLKTNQALGTSKDLVKRTGSEMVKTFSAALVRRVGSEVVKYTGNVAEAKQETAGVAGETNRWASAFGKLKKAWNSDLPALRYALYDVSRSLTTISTASLAFAVAPIGFSIKYEREFANVVRTNELVGISMEQTRKKLRAELIEITQTTPISWADVTQIATLGGQLGIARGYITDFTETVAKFAATTDLTVDGAATAFGRLNQLIRGIDGDFNSLGSAILAVGVDSVATESQIVNVSTQIASMGNLAGLTAPEIIGLSGAMASLGIRPELARGTVTRLFSNIGKSAVEGGYNVEEFGRLTGRTADQFVSDWSTRPGDVLQDFFDGINADGPNAERTLRQLGITSVRDIPAILRLAQSSDEVRRLIALSSDEYLYGTKVTEQYGIISGTTAEQINRLGQNFQTLQASIGDSIGPLALYFQYLNQVAQGLTLIADSPVGQFLSGLAIILALIIGTLTALGGALIGVVAAKVALNFAAKQLGITLSMQTVKALFTSKAATDALTISNVAAAASVRALGVALRSVAIIGVVVTVLGLLVALVGELGNKTSKTDENVQKFFGGLESLRDAIDRDTESFDKLTGSMKDGTKAIAVYEREVVKTESSIANMRKESDAFVDADGEVVTAIKETTEALLELQDATQTFALGPEVLDFFKGALLQNVDIASAFADPVFQQAWVDAGGNISDLLRAGIEGRGGEYVDEIVKDIEAQIKEVVARRRELNLADDTGGEEYQAVNEEIALLKSQLEIVKGPIRDFAESQDEAIEGAIELGTGVGFMADEMAELEDRTALADNVLKGIINTLFSAANNTKKVEDSFLDLAKAMAENTDEAMSASGAIQKVITSILDAPDGNVDVILGNLSGLLFFLKSQGPETAAAQELVRQAIESVGLEAGYTTGEVYEYAASLNAVATFDPAKFSEAYNNAMDKVAKSSSGAASKVKTLAEKFDELVQSMFAAINLGRDAEEAIFALGEAFGESGDEALYASGEMQDAIRAILKQSDSAEQGVANLAALLARLGSTAGVSSPSLDILRQTIQQVGLASGLSAQRIQQLAASAGAGLSNINLNNFNRGIEKATKTVRTLLDYARDLESVFSRAFDIRFARTIALDSIAESFQKLAESVEDARIQLDELKESQKDLSADRGLKQYFLSIAEAYGDTLRAAQLRKEIADLDKQQIKNARDIAKTQQLAGADLTTQGPGSRQNRQALLGLVKNYQDYITALAESGASQAELTAATERSRQEFTEQARELGFQEADIRQYAQAFDDVQTAISKVERNITVEANVNPALQALNELNASLNKQIQAANDLNRALNQPVAARTGGTTPGTPSGPTRADDSSVAARKAADQAELRSARADLASWDAEVRRLANAKPYNLSAVESARRSQVIAYQEVRALEAKLRSYAIGGFTGQGGKFEPAGIVHKGEYVIPKQFVNQSSGMPDPMFLAQMQSGMRNYFNGGFVGAQGGNDGTMMVELSPFDRKLLADAGNVQLRLNGRVVAEATNQNNFEQARRGSD